MGNPVQSQPSSVTTQTRTTIRDRKTLTLPFQDQAACGFASTLQSLNPNPKLTAAFPSKSATFNNINRIDGFLLFFIHPDGWPCSTVGIASWGMTAVGWFTPSPET